MPAKKSKPSAEPAAPVEPPVPSEPLAPVAPPAPPAPQTTYVQPQPLSPGDERTWAMLAHLSMLVNLISGILGPVAALVIYMVYQNRSRYVAYHALQSLLLQLIGWVGGWAVAGVAWGISGALSAFIIGFICMPFACLLSLVPLGALVYAIIGAVQTSQGRDFKYWLIGDWARGTLTG